MGPEGLLAPVRATGVQTPSLADRRHLPGGVQLRGDLPLPDGSAAGRAGGRPTGSAGRALLGRSSDGRGGRGGPLRAVRGHGPSATTTTRPALPGTFSSTSTSAATAPARGARRDFPRPPRRHPGGALSLGLEGEPPARLHPVRSRSTTRRVAAGSGPAARSTLRVRGPVGRPGGGHLRHPRAPPRGARELLRRPAGGRGGPALLRAERQVRLRVDLRLFLRGGLSWLHRSAHALLQRPAAAHAPRPVLGAHPQGASAPGAPGPSRSISGFRHFLRQASLSGVSWQTAAPTSTPRRAREG